jgi:hypothetical protein
MVSGSAYLQHRIAMALAAAAAARSCHCSLHLAPLLGSASLPDNSGEKSTTSEAGPAEAEPGASCPGRIWVFANTRVYGRPALHMKYRTVFRHSRE